MTSPGYSYVASTRSPARQKFKSETQELLESPAPLTDAICRGAQGLVGEAAANSLQNRTEINALKDFSEAKRKPTLRSIPGSTTCGLTPHHDAFVALLGKADVKPSLTRHSPYAASSTDLLPAHHAGFNSTRGQNGHSNKREAGPKEGFPNFLTRCRGQQQLSAPGHRCSAINSPGTS